MPSTYTPNKSYELQATGENDGTWGVLLDAVLSIIDLNQGGRLNLSVAGSSNVTLSTTQAKNVYHNLTGVLTGNIDYIFPATNGGYYFIKNATSGAFTLTVKPAGGTGISVPQGTTLAVMIDPDQTSAVLVTQPLIVSGGGLEYSSSSLRRSALTGDVTASAGSNATVLGITTTRGDLIARGASVNGRLAVGTANQLLKSDGTDPGWGTLTALLDTLFSSSQGALLYRGASAWAGLAPGTSGQALLTGGAGGNPAWSAAAPLLKTGGTLTGAFVEAVSVLTDGATPALDATLGNIFTLTAAGNRTIAVPSGAVSGQKILIRHTASGGARTLALNTGAGGFRYGETITGLTATTSGKTDYIGCIYNAAASFWDVVAYVKGY